MARTIRIGLIGAGEIFRLRHLPKLRQLEGVQLVAVANRSLESGRAVAQAWNIPHVLTDWRELIRREDIDAVFIGTWPYMHAEMSIAALAAGKHVFCQARMAMDLEEARAMLDAARAHPHLVNMLCPPPQRILLEDVIRPLVESRALGDLAAARVECVNDASLRSDVLHWRENVVYSGRQIMAVGIMAEVLNAWLGPYENLTASMATIIEWKKDEAGRSVRVQVPQTVAIHGRLRRGVICSEVHCGAAAGVADESWFHLYGTEASLRHRLNSATVEIARRGGSFEPIPLPSDRPATLDEAWTVEQDFIDAVRRAIDGEPPERRRLSPDFAEGLEYMKKVEAIHQSASTGRLIDLGEL